MHKIGFNNLAYLLQVLYIYSQPPFIEMIHRVLASYHKIYNTKFWPSTLGTNYKLRLF